MTSGPIQVLELYWDGADHLRQVKENGVVVFTATYNGEGLRVSKWDLWTGQHDYTWGPGGVLYDTNGNTTFTPGLAQHSGSTDRFFHTDWLGSTRWMSDGANGNSFPVYALFDSFGNRQTDVTTPGSFSAFQWGGAVGYQTEYADPSVPGLGLVYMQQRYYDPAIGRFISPDPIGYAGGLNLYAYCDNDPINRLDPFGLVWRERLSIVGGILGGIAGAPEGGIGAIPGAAFGAGIGGYIGSRLDGEGIGQSALNGGCDAGLTYIGGEVGEAVVGRLGPILSKIPRPALKLRPGYVRIPGLTLGGQTGTGEVHHVLSQRILRALSKHPTLSGLLKRNWPRFLARAEDALAHKGYQDWHRAYDAEVEAWLQANDKATLDQFIDFLREIYARPPMQQRFPGYPGP